MVRTLRISVRRLVEFLLRTGDIDAERDGRGGVELMQAGSNIHRMLQAAAGKAYQAEVSLSCSIFFPDGAFSPHAARLDIREEAVSDQHGFFLCIEGRADGVIDDGKQPLLIDEIKGVSRDVSAIEEPDALHEAQALCYAYLYLRSSRRPSALSTSFGEQIVVRLTYASMTTGEVRQLERTHLVPDIEAWFFSLLDNAQRWAAWRVRHDELRRQSLSSLTFPLAARDGQRELMAAVTTAIHKGGRLYAQAPTGSGKTIATLFPALKAIGTGEAARIAYLTAKTMTRAAALACLDLLRHQDFAAKVLAVTARDKLCPLRTGERGAEVRARPLASLCNPIECPLARGHYDVINDALFEAIDSSDVLDRERITTVAARHHVCPYELQRDVARWADVIVCDYHFAFAPSASLFGLSDEPDGGDTVFLVDEAHNLTERMREMYSAELFVDHLERLARLLRQRHDLDELANAVQAAIAAFPSTGPALPAARSGTKRRSSHSDYQVVRMSDEFREALAALAESVKAALELLSPATASAEGQGRHTGTPRGRAVELYLDVRDVDFEIRGFLGAMQRTEAGYVTFLSRDAHGDRKLKIYCLDPSHDLAERLEQAKATVFFSGTLLPMDYHRKLLAAQPDDASLFVPSAFDPRQQQILIGSDVNARYAKRGPELYARIATYLVTLTRERPGNYLAFLPSYVMMEEVAKALHPLLDSQTTLARQRPGMREDERERFVAQFRKPRTQGTSLMGLCVLGGIFGESIDLPGEALVGVVVVGTGVPRATGERELIRDYYDVKEGRGFAYAYTYPGMIKVLQAAGRLIRTEEDRGMVLLLDDRFLEADVQAAFPQEWTDTQVCTVETLPDLLQHG